ncbi:hypothetical protein K525DRAFT_260848, partial [Schizophyllum commune Loenen D]
MHTQPPAHPPSRRAKAHPFRPDSTYAHGPDTHASTQRPRRRTPTPTTTHTHVHDAHAHTTSHRQQVVNPRSED